MQGPLTPEKIYHDLTNGALNIEMASDMLISLIEGSDETKVRMECIELFEKKDIKNEKIFRILENCLLSDESSLVRSVAAKVIILNFSKEGADSLRWVIQHDKSPIVLKLLFDFEDKFNDPRFELLKKDMSCWLENFGSEIGIVSEEARFILDLEALFAKGKNNYEINIDIYQFCESIRNTNIKDGSWLLIKNSHVEELSFNYFYWRFLKDVPDSYNSLAKLSYLDLYFTFLKKIDSRPNDNLKIPNSIGLLTELKKLDLSRNKLKEIPDSIGSLISLEKLDLSRNKLKKLPDSIGLLKSLKKLNLSRNNLQEVPETIGSLTLLKSLDLSRNLISEIPASIKNLKVLTELKLSNNNIQKIPKSIKSFLNSLRRLKY
ncbi:MAG: leucine-rich repeat domain-containing protein [Promethearchaeota archaeon]